MGDAFPPSLPRTDIFKTHTYHHAPGIEGPAILGVDEAGRGPVLGPMVYAAAYCAADYRETLAKQGFADSKVLSADFRTELLQNMCVEGEMRENIGWATTIMTAVDISSGMLQPGIAYNLNEQAHDTTMALIQLVLDSGVNVAEAYIDTVGPPEKYQAKLSQRFPTIKFTVTKKADSLFPIVSCASICAKVSRDASLEEQLQGCGSGYPSDPNTVAWLKANMDKLFGWGPLVRYSWATAVTMLDQQGHGVDWPDHLEIEGGSEKKGLPRWSLDHFAHSA